MTEISEWRASLSHIWRHAMAPMRSVGHAAGVAALLIGAAPGSVPGVEAREPAAAVGAPVYLKALEDIPLMPGLAERPYEGITFETRWGRIVEAVAWSPPATGLTPGRVIAFYRATLAALGWKVLGGGRFAREGEILRISTGGGANGLEVKFSLRPK